jgi:hypothetical protein
MTSVEELGRLNIEKRDLQDLEFRMALKMCRAVINGLTKEQKVLLAKNLELE